MSHPNIPGTPSAASPTRPYAVSTTSTGGSRQQRGARITHGVPTFRALIAGPLTRPRRTVLALAATLVGCSLSACSGIGGGQTDTAPPDATVSASQDTQGTEDARDAQDTQDDSAGDTFTVALDKTATWNNGVKAHLSGFSRGTSGQYASPSGKPYLAFSVTLENGSKSSIDLSMVSLSCPDGADEIFDTEAGFDGTPDTHVLPGKSQTWKAACAFPRTARNAQIEITPTDTSGSGWYRTAIFTGQVQ
ncbi:hypothetical protein [Streptomyces mexicanus]|jgi:hypothetical protein|uniref:hypothetical protein n=1 Tax=Streptomyces mexicanus TaxID=178566 RepID=UPI003663057F